MSEAPCNCGSTSRAPIAPDGRYAWNLTLSSSSPTPTTPSTTSSTASNYVRPRRLEPAAFSTADWKATGSASWSQTDQASAALVLSAGRSRGGTLVRRAERRVRGVHARVPVDVRRRLRRDPPGCAALPAPLGQKATCTSAPTLSARAAGRSLTRASAATLRGGLGARQPYLDHTDLSSVDQATAAAQISACYELADRARLPARRIPHGLPYNLRTQPHEPPPPSAASSQRRRPDPEPAAAASATPVSQLVQHAGSTRRSDAWQRQIDRAIASGGTLIIGGHAFTSTSYDPAPVQADRRLRGAAPPVDADHRRVVEHAGDAGTAGETCRRPLALRRLWRRRRADRGPLRPEGAGPRGTLRDRGRRGRGRLRRRRVCRGRRRRPATRRRAAARRSAARRRPGRGARPVTGRLRARRQDLRRRRRRRPAHHLHRRPGASVAARRSGHAGRRAGRDGGRDHCVRG